MAPEKRLKKAGDGQDQDPTTRLPASVLACILSLLPLRTALLCGTLSKAFLAALRELLAHATELDFGPDFADELPLKSYSSMVDRAISLHQAQTLHCLKIHLPWAGERVQRCLDQSCLGPWLRFAASKRVRMLQLDCAVVGIYADLSDLTTLTHLSLRRCDLYSPSRRAPRIIYQLPSLQVLSLWEVRIQNDELADLLRGCPLLSVLKLKHCNALSHVTIASPKNLRCLTIISCQLCTIRIYVWKLQSFHFFGRPVSTVCMYEKGAANLRDVYINTGRRYGNQISMVHHFSALAQITTLTLSDSFLEGLYRDRGVMQPTFCNLKNLHLIVGEYGSFMLLCDVLQSFHFPCLENLFIEFLTVPKDELSTENILLKFDELRFVSIKGFQGFESQMAVAKFFLECAGSLETLLLVMAEPLAEHKAAFLRERLDAIAKASLDSQIVLCGADDVPLNLPLPPHAELHSEIVEYYRRRVDLEFKCFSN